MLPKPWHVGHAPNGLLNENSRGCGSSYAIPQSRQSKRSEKRWTLPRLVARRRQLDRPRSAAAFQVRRLDRVGDPLPEIAAVEPHAIDDHLQRRPILQRCRSTSSNDTARPSTSRRPNPLRRSASMVAATAPAPADGSVANEAFASAGSVSARRQGPRLPADRLRNLLARGSHRLPPPRRDRGRPNRRIDDRQIEAEQQPRAGREFAQLPPDHFRRFSNDFPAAVATEGPANARVEQPQVVVDLGRRADGRSRVADAVLLADRDGRRDAVDSIDVRLLHPLEELPRVRRQRFHVAPLALGVDRVEGERRLARSAHARDDDEPAGGQRQVDVLQVVGARAADDETCGRSSGSGENAFGHT